MKASDSFQMPNFNAPPQISAGDDASHAAQVMTVRRRAATRRPTDHAEAQNYHDPDLSFRNIGTGKSVKFRSDIPAVETDILKRFPIALHEENQVVGDAGPLVTYRWRTLNRGESGSLGTAREQGRTNCHKEFH
jgi:hypothetical protein